MKFPIRQSRSRGTGHRSRGTGSVSRVCGILCALCVSVANSQMPPPAAAGPHPLYFAVTDVDSNGLSSSWSNELVWTNGSANLTNLSWDAPTPIAAVAGQGGSNGVDHYVLYWGYRSRTYIFSRNLSAATNQSWPLPTPPSIWQKTFNYLSGPSVTGPWSTNTAILCTVTGSLPNNAGYTRSGPIIWKRIQ
jgi:hypothetical protein